MNIALELTREELIGEPQPRTLATGKSILSFNVKLSDKIANLNTGSKFGYRNELYEIMNREPVDSSQLRYIKFNCIHKIVSSSA